MHLAHDELAICLFLGLCGVIIKLLRGPFLFVRYLVRYTAKRFGSKAYLACSP